MSAILAYAIALCAFTCQITLARSSYRASMALREDFNKGELMEKYLNVYAVYECAKQIYSLCKATSPDKLVDFISQNKTRIKTILLSVEELCAENVIYNLVVGNERDGVHCNLLQVFSLAMCNIIRAKRMVNEARMSESEAFCNFCNAILVVIESMQLLYEWHQIKIVQVSKKIIVDGVSHTIH